MNKFYFLIYITLTVLPAFSQNKNRLVSQVQRNNLNKLGYSLKIKSQINLNRAFQLAKINNWPIVSYTNDGGVIALQGVDIFNKPRYLTTFNATSSETTHTNQLYAGGSLGLNLNGESENLINKLAIWDGGAILFNHQELNGRIVPKDTATTIVYHATHVAGTMIASGINAEAKGMAWGAPNLLVYDFNDDIPEIAGAAGNLLLSNHSYGYQAGWVRGDNGWEWLGVIGENEDYKFGIYDEITHNWDAICYQAPYYLPVVACGNSRTQNGPAVGDPYYGYPDIQTLPVLIGNRPEGISSNNSYDIISMPATAKNILSVGAVFKRLAGSNLPSDIKISNFSSWGPTDDGRIKPDIVGQGVAVLSASNISTIAYGTSNGTSMACPNVSGSLLLLQQYYSNINQGKFMLAATLKGLALHTTDEAGAALGPDYMYGWGLLNTERAATTIKNNGSSSLIIEKNLNQGETYTQNFKSSGLEPLKVTVCWTDPAGIITPDGTLNNRTPKLVNDLDIKLQNDSTTFFPWILNPLTPAMAATTGNNMVDNVEQIVNYNPKENESFTINVSHKGQILNGNQNFSLIISGIEVNTLDFSVYPIPAKDKINLSMYSVDKQNITFSISNLIGEKLYQKTINNVIGAIAESISVANFLDGIYFINVQLGNKNLTKKIVVNHNTP